jgi:hypothetical protein
LASTPKPRSAISESQKSASSGWSITPMGSALDRTIDQRTEDWLNTESVQGRASGARIDELLPAVYHEICKGNNTDISPAKESRDIQDA